jgi:hypothetical protein
MGDPSRLYWSDKVQRGMPIQTKFCYKITGAKAVTEQTSAASKVFFDALSSQADDIDAFLETTNEFLLASFAATPMGTGAIGFLFNMEGQVQELIAVEVKLMSGTDLSTIARTAQNVFTTVGATLAQSFALGANGNVAGHTVFTGLDAMNAGIIEVTLSWRSK